MVQYGGDGRRDATGDFDGCIPTPARDVQDAWLVSFLDFDLRYFDEAVARVEPGANPFASKVSTMSPG
jgi:hypothetical protein